MAEEGDQARSSHLHHADAPARDDAPAEREQLLARLQADCAQLLEANRRLREAAQRRDELLSFATGDLRAPLAVIRGQVRLLLQGSRGNLSEAQRKAIESIERQARGISELGEVLLELKTLEVGRLELRRAPTDLAKLLGDVADACAPSARERGLELHREMPPFPLSVPADGSRLRDVLGALLWNAVAATPRGGRIVISLEAVGDTAQITVEDGRLDAEAMPRPARWLERSVLDPSRLGGFGLGLAICREIVQLHGGRLDTGAAGAGHRARIVLPVTLPSDEGARGRALPAPGRPRVLVIEDDAAAREALCLMLQDSYDMRMAADGQEGVEEAQAGRPDLVLMDLFMPRMDGFAALEAFRADALTADIPIIIISARADDTTRSRALDLGAVDFLQKPLSERELRARIERTLRVTRRETQLQELARTDPLTGLSNVRAFRARLADEAKRARRYRTPLTCVMADMDHLKPINDQLGHAAGDQAIAAVAEVIHRELRETDFGARYGGDEFVVLLPHTSAVEGRIFAERVCARLRDASVEAKGRRMPILASFGVASLPDDTGEADPGDVLVRRADAALYAAKHAGRGQVAVHPEDREPGKSHP